MRSRQKIYILHGWAVNQFNQGKWQPLMSELEKNQLDPIFLGIPGLSTSLNKIWNLDDFVGWLAKELPVKEKVILLGHSFGGQLAIRFAAEYPDRVKKLILIDSSGIRDQSWSAKFKRNLFWLAAKLGKFFFRFDAARKLLYLLARERDYYSAPPLLRRSMSLVLDDEIRADLPKIQAPTLIIWGAADTITPLKIAKLKQRQIPKAQLSVIDGAKHSPQFTHVDQVTKQISSFV